MKKFDEIFERVRMNCHHTPPVTDDNATPKAIVIDKDDLLSVCRHLLGDEGLYFDSLSCVTGVDNGPAAGTMEVIYNFYSIPFDHHLMLKVIIPRENPKVESVSHLWRTADWLEREIFDMYGIVFQDHPDLRRILMPADWEGYPLRKDYKQQEYYRDIKVAF